VAAFDPFVECSSTGNWKAPEPEGPKATPIPQPARILRWAGALVVGVGLSGAVYLIIDNVYDEDRKAWNDKYSGKKPSPTKKTKKVVVDDE
jgi:hypothetical protein